eukprot:6468264-Amphidinium_carterae.2
MDHCAKFFGVASLTCVSRGWSFHAHSWMIGFYGMSDFVIVCYVEERHWLMCATTCANMDHAGGAANRHVLYVKSTEHTFHYAPLLQWLLLPAGSDAVEKNNLARVCKVCPRQVGMVLTFVPGIWYSVVKAVPGFLQQVSGLWRWLISNAVAWTKKKRTSKWAWIVPSNETLHYFYIY